MIWKWRGAQDVSIAAVGLYGHSKGHPALL